MAVASIPSVSSAIRHVAQPQIRSLSVLGLIAGNGRFPFLVLDAARAQGHDVTIIAAKEEAFSELNEAAARHRSAIHWISLGQLSTCLKLLQEAGVSHAVMAGQVKHTKIFSGGIVPDLAF